MNKHYYYKKCISAIVAIALLLIITVVSILGFSNWFNTYSQGIYSNVEISSKTDTSSVGIETVVGNTLYVKNSLYNMTIKDIKIDGISCYDNDTIYNVGVLEIDISDCIKNVSISNPNVMIVTDKGIIEKNVLLKTVSKSDCLHEGVLVLHGYSNIFYLQEFSSLGCVNETRTCNNGILSGSYNYTNCSTELALGGDYIEDFEIDGTNYRAHIFTQAGEHSFIVHKNNLDVDYLVVAGGGGSGYIAGGGAGGMLNGSLIVLNDTYNVLVGAGGMYTGPSGTTYGTNGNDSVFDGIVAYGGGTGGKDGATVGMSGGSGGGGGAQGSTGALGGAGVLGQGNNGGNGGNSRGGSGGGAGSSGSLGGIGGSGKVSEILPLDVATSLDIGEIYNNQVWFAGGGGSYIYPNQWVGGGVGGGGYRSADGTLHYLPKNTTGGGGGGHCGQIGGSGIVIIRYAID